MQVEVGLFWEGCQVRHTFRIGPCCMHNQSLCTSTRGCSWLLLQVCPAAGNLRFSSGPALPAFLHLLLLQVRWPCRGPQGINPTWACAACCCGNRGSDCPCRCTWLWGITMA